MLLNAKKLAFLGLLLACVVILMILSGVFEFNTLFLIAGASFCVGIAIRETGIRIGFGFYIASILLSFMFAPNKLYCVTYAALGFYLVIAEYAYDKLALMSSRWNRTRVYWIIKLGTFNLMYLSIVFFLPRLIYQGAISKVIVGLLIVAGQAALLVYDKAYHYFQGYIWEKVRGKLNL